MTKFLNDHPCGAKSITLFAAKDAAEEIDMLQVINKHGLDAGTVAHQGASSGSDRLGASGRGLVGSVVVSAPMLSAHDPVAAEKRSTDSA